MTDDCFLDHPVEPTERVWWLQMSSYFC